jgi:hypothetical protein
VEDGWEGELEGRIMFVSFMMELAGVYVGIELCWAEISQVASERLSPFTWPGVDFKAGSKCTRNEQNNARSRSPDF